MNGVFPEQGSSGGGTQVTIVGHHLGGATAVHFGARSALSFIVVDDRTVKAVSPSGGGAVPVSVTTPGGTAMIGYFIYLPVPHLSRAAPGSGPLGGGNPVTLTGVNLYSAESVHFGDTTVFPTVLTDQRLVVVAPAADVPSTVPVYANAVGGVSNRLPYTYAADPTVFGVSPVSGPIVGGTTVLVSGTGLGGVTGVTFGGFSAPSFRSYSGTLMVAVTPPGLTGPAAVTVTTPGGSATLPGAFTFRAESETVVTSGPGPSVSGEPVVFTATVTGIPMTARTPTGTITLEFGDGTPGVTAPLTGGTATVVHAYTGPSADPYTVTASYDGDSDFYASTGTDSRTVARAATITTVVGGVPDPVVFGEAVTLGATVTPLPPGAGVPSGTVTFTVSGTGGGTFTGALDGTGTATVVAGALGTGDHDVSATYDGDAAFTGSTGTGTQTVDRSVTVTRFTTPPNPSVVGETATAVAVVEAVSPGAGIPTGTVTFALSGGESGEVPLDATGTASASGSFPAGVYFSSATYNGDADFAGSDESNIHTVEQASTSTSVVSSPDPSLFGAAVTVTATVAPVAPGAGVPTGSVTYLIDGGGPVDAPLDGSGQALLVTSALAPGGHDITAVYGGDTQFTGSSGSGTQTVAQAGTTTAVVSGPDPSVFGQAVTFTAAVESAGAGAPTGTVVFTVDGPGGGSFTGAVNSAGVAAVTTSGLEAGVHSVTAVYGGDANFTGSTGTGTQTVAEAATSTTVSSSPDPSAFGETVTLAAVVSAVGPGAGTPTGTVSFTVGGVGGGTLTGTVDDSGVATVSTDTLGFGAHAVTAVYNGDADLLSSTASITHSVVTQPSTTTAVTSSPSPSLHGETVVFTAIVAPVAPATGIPTGTVAFVISGSGGGTLTGTLNASGVATVSTGALGAQVHGVTASYSGDSTFDASSSSTTHTVAQAATSTVVLASPGPSVFGQQFAVTATVAAVAPGAGVPTGSVTFRVSGGQTATVSLDAGGTAGFTTSTPVGTGDHTITAVYSGDTDFTTSTGTATQTVGQASTTTRVTSSPDPSTFGQLVTLGATVVPVLPGAGVPSGVVTFTVGGPGGGIVTAPVDSGGSASVGISTLAAGDHTITAVYSGDTDFATSTGTDSQTVGQASTTTRVTSSPDPSTFGQLVTLGATVVPVLPGAGVPSGVVTFTVGGPGGGILTAPVDSGGSASVGISTLAAGSHSVTAVYSGDAGFATSTGTDSQTVGQASTTTRVTSSPDPSVFGQSVTVTATVAPVTPGAGVPSGAVTFTIDGAGPFDVAVDAAGQASLSNSTLAAGSHTVTAVYNGDGNFTASTGTDSHTVAQAATITTVVGGVPDPAVFGEAVTLGATVTPLPPGAGVPSGTVTFTVSGTGGGTFTGALDGTGTATVVAGALGTGDHDVSATYDGDAAFTGSTGTGTQTVDRSVTVTRFTTPPNPSVVGETATAVAVVEAVSPGAGIPTGTVTFALSGGESGQVPLDATGTASASGSFPVGVYLSSATYNGDANFTESSDSNTHTVGRATTTTTVVSSPDPSRFGQPFTVTATVVPVAPGSGTVTGSVTVTIDGDGGGVFTAPVDATGRATVTTSTPTAGSHSITAVYSGDIDFAGSSGSHSHTVGQATTTTTVASLPAPSRFGQAVTVSARVTAGPPGAGVPTGTVSFTVSGDGGGVFTAPVDSTGLAAVTINTLIVGSHSVSAAYGGDVDFTGSTGTNTLTVTQAATSTTVSSSPDPSAFGETVTLAAVVSPVGPGAGTPTGTVSFTVSGVGGGTLTGTVDASGVATASTDTLGFGAHTVTAVYNGDANLMSSTGSTTHSVVTQPSTVTTVIASPEPSAYGQSVTLSATVNAVPPATGTPTGTVTFTISGSGGGSVPGTLNGSGVATVSTAALGAGTHSVTATYHGDPTFAPSNGSATHTVNQTATSTTVTATPGPSTYGEQVTVSATVAPLTPGAAIPTGTVSFTSSTGSNLTVPLDALGTATYTTASPFQAGTETITATYNGDANFTTSTGSHSHIVNQATTTTTLTSSPDPSVVGQPVTLTAAVAAVPPGAGVPSGTVTFTIGGPGGGTLTATVASGGIATVTTGTLAAGSHTITAVYGGAANFTSSTGSDTQTVNASATTTTVGSAPDPSVVGQSVTLSASVAAVSPGAGVPTGSVAFSIDGAAPVSASLNGSGQATVTTGTLAAGSHTITAVYGGAANFTSSTGSDTQTVNASATTTTVGSAPDPSVVGQSVTLSASVAAVPPGAGIPTGSVTFTLSGTGGGTLTGALDASGVATVTTGTLAAGSHTITAVYGGAANFTSSTGTDTQSVNAQSPTVTSLAPTFGTSAGGTAFTLTGTNLTGAAVTFGGTAVTSVTVNSAGTVLTGTTPAHAAGNAIVQVTTTAGTTTAPGGYTYTLQRVYVTNQNSNSVSVINTLTNLVVGTPVTVGTSPQGVAITPNGATAYVANFASNSVSVIDTGSNTVIKTIPLGTGHGPQGVAVTPNGTRVYVTNQSSNTVSVIDTAANALIGSAITVGSTPSGVAITVDGTRAYVTNFNSGTVSVIDTATNLVVGTPITVGTSPYGVAVAPDRPRAYVTNQNSNSVSAINTSANTVIGAPIPVGTNPRGVAVTPDGTRAYVANFKSGTVSVIDTGPNTVIGSPVAVGANPIGVAITSDGTRAYVTNNGSTTVSVINTTTNLVVGTVTTGTAPDGAAITAF